MDLLIRDARVADVEAGRLVPADVGVRGDTIELVAPGGTTRAARRELRVDGLVVAPGFIDLHTHTDFTLPVHPRADAMVRQGVTLQVSGNCGFSPFPVAPGLRDFTAFLDGGLDWAWDGIDGYVRALEDRPLATNVALQVGHGAARIAAMGFDERAPSAAELDAIERHVADGFEHGAFGVSTGLIYAPGRFAETDELVAVAAVAARYGGFYSSHIRDEAAGLLPAVTEAIDVGRRAGVPVQLSHHKAAGRANWGGVAASLRLIDDARREGLDVLADQYPYTAGSTTLASIVPGWASAGGIDGLRRRLADPAARAQIRAELLAGPFDPETIAIGAIRAGSAAADLEGRRLTEIALARGEEPVDVALDLLREHGGGVQMILFAMSEDDVATVLRHPCVAVASDGWTLAPAAGGRPHPRSYGTYARVLGHYVRGGILPLIEALRKMTALPARRLGLADRGRVAPGCAADLVIFDPDTVDARATFEDPHRFAVGVHHVVVNGGLVIEDGRDTGLAAGRVLRP